MVCSCYQAPEIDGFDQGRWNNGAQDCRTSRLPEAQIILSEFSTIKGSSQNEMKLLLGKPSRHQLFNRNQKFFFYQLTCPDSLNKSEYLRLRFDALGSLREGTLELME